MSPDERRRRPRQETPSIKIAIDSLDGAEAKRRALRHLVATVDLQELVRVRAVQHTLLEATWAYWMRRAQSFAAIGTPDADRIALACRRHARLLSGEFGEVEPWPGFAEDLAAVLGEGGLDASA
jgi:hypothetical protein